MKKIVILKLASIQHSGQFIGDDIRIEIDALDVLYGINKIVQKGGNVDVNKEVLRHIIDQNSFSLPIVLRVIERDSIYDDVGIREVSLPVNLNSSSSQKSTHQISVIESHGIFRKKEAIFDVTLDIQVVEMIRYIEETNDGWLDVLMEDGVTEQSLPSYLKVLWNETKAERDYFTIMEGWLRGKKRSVTLDPDDGRSYLVEGYPYGNPVKMTYSISKRILTVKGKKYLATDYPSATWEKGMYHVSIPGSPHDTDYPAKKDKVWFLINYGKNDRFIHIGQRSRGCITLLDHDRWDNELYPILIRARTGDGLHIGTVEIID